MSYTLFHYVHCPFCLRVRMAMGLLNVPYQSIPLPYDDEETPIKLTGKKMLPILKHDNGVMNESLDIIKFIDQNNILKVSETVHKKDFLNLEKLLNDLGNPIHSLAMPYWIWTAEFNENSRSYFQKKKEEKRGPFKNLVKRHDDFVIQLEPILKSIEERLSPFYESKNLSLNDILLASHLWGLYIVPEFQFSPGVHSWLQNVKAESNFNYHQDLWS